ncbi:MAG TPA: hypothetical protein VKV96_11120 [Roseiarcus sp.]|nr:hypothetical protein [Roseiarcus sp.]
MDKKTLGVLGAASALAIVAAAPAAADASAGAALKPAQSFSELLDPIPNAVETLAAVETETPATATKPALMQVAQDHHHHHHHHHYVYRHHHHHHHHHVVRRIIRHIIHHHD